MAVGFKKEIIGKNIRHDFPCPKCGKHTYHVHPFNLVCLTCKALVSLQYTEMGTVGEVVKNYDAFLNMYK